MSCEHNDDRSRSCGVRRSGDETGARLLRSGQSRGRNANALRSQRSLGDSRWNAPPAPWIDLGWVSGFTRKCATKVDALRAGAPAMQPWARFAVEMEATVSLEFEVWGRLQATLASGSQQTNLLTTAAGAAPNGSGGVAAAPVPLLTGTGLASTATSLNVGTTAAAGFSRRQPGCRGCRLHRPAWIHRHRRQHRLCAIRKRSGWRRELCPPSDAERRRRHRHRCRRTAACRARCLRVCLRRACRSANWPASAIARVRASFRSGLRSLSCAGAQGDRVLLPLPAPAGDAGFGGGHGDAWQPHWNRSAWQRHFARCP